QAEQAPSLAKWCSRADGTCGQQSRRGLGDTDGFAFVPHTVAVFGTASVGHRDSKIAPTKEVREIPGPTGESYLLNPADYDRQRDNAANFRIFNKRLRRGSADHVPPQREPISGSVDVYLYGYCCG